MSRTVTLGQLHTDIREQADLVSSTARHSPALITRLINQSIQRFRERLSLEGSTHYLVSVAGSLTSGATSPYAFKSLDLSAVTPGVVRTFEVEITVNNQNISLLHVPFAARNDYGGPQVTGLPAAWAHYQTRKLAILPAPNATYPYSVWYLPVLADLVNDNDTFDGNAGWEDFIVWDVVRKLIVRDQYPEAYGMASSYAGEIWEDILKMATKVSSAGGAVIGRDTMGQRRAGWQQRDRLPWP